MEIEQFPVTNRWTGVSQSRRSSPRAKVAVRARVSHTSAQKRRLDIYLTGPVVRQLGWLNGGTVEPRFAMTDNALLVRLSPAHKGVKAAKQSPSSETVRVAISGAPLANGLCAKVRDVTFMQSGNELIAYLPSEWAAGRTFEAVEAEQVLA